MDVMTYLSAPEIDAGIFLIDKPVGVTSFGVVSRLRRILRMKKVGHAGIFDPFATGLLIVCAGRPATKLISRFMDGEKEYLATLRLGVETETQDTEGAVIGGKPVGELTPLQVEECLQNFRGTLMQVPPAYSALKHQGKPLYFYARKGITITKEPRQIEIKTLARTDGCQTLSGEQADLGIRVICTKGTYIRTLAADIGKSLGCGAHLVQLRRMRSGPFTLENSLSWDDLTGDEALSNCLGKMMTVDQVCNLLQ